MLREAMEKRMRPSTKQHALRAMSWGLLLLAASGIAAAEDRMPPLEPGALNEAQRAAVAALEAARGYGPRGPWIPLLRSPEVLNRARAMGDYLRFKSVLAPTESEFLILLTARQWMQQYEWLAHSKIALEAGVPAASVTEIAAGRRPTEMSHEQAVLYDLWSEITRQHRVSDETYAAAVQTFAEQGVIDALGIIGYYTFLAMIMNTAETPVPDGATAPLGPLP